MMLRCSLNGRRRPLSAKTGRRVAWQLRSRHLTALLLGLVGTGMLIHLADGYGWCSDTWSWGGRQQAKDGSRWPTEDGMVITYINGIYHSESEWATITQKLEAMFRHEVRPFYNPSSGWWITDASKAWYHLLRRPANASVVQGLGQHLAEAVKDVGRGRVLHIAHSGGALITYLAAQYHLNPRQRDKIDVLTFGGARSLTRKYFSGRVVNYYARNDPLVMLDRRAAELMRLSNDTTFEAVNDKHNSSFVFLEGLAKHFVQDHSLEGPTYQCALNREAKAFRRSHFGPLSSHGWDYETSPLRLVRKQAAQLSGQHQFFSNAAESWRSLRKEAARLTGMRGFFSGKLFQWKDLPGVEVVVGKDEPSEPAYVPPPPSRNATLYVETLKASIAKAVTWSRWRRAGDGYNGTVGRGSEPEWVASSGSLVPETRSANSEERFWTRGRRWIPGASSTGSRVRSTLSPDPQDETNTTDEREQGRARSYPYTRAWNALRFPRRNGSDASGSMTMASNGSLGANKGSGPGVCPPDVQVSGNGPIEGEIEVRPPPDGEGKPWFSIGWLSWGASRGADPNGAAVARVRFANLATSDAGEEAFEGDELLSVEDNDGDNEEAVEQQPASRSTRWWSTGPATSSSKTPWSTPEDHTDQFVAEHGGSGQGSGLSARDEDGVREMAERDLNGTTTKPEAPSDIPSIPVESSGSGLDPALGWGSASTMKRAQVLVRRLWPSASDRDPVAGSDERAVLATGKFSIATALSESGEEDRDVDDQLGVVSPLAISVETPGEQADTEMVNSPGSDRMQQVRGESRGTDTNGVSSYSRLWASLTGARNPTLEGNEGGASHEGRGDNDGGGTPQVGEALGDIEMERLSGELMLGEQLRREGHGMSVEGGVSREGLRPEEGFEELELDTTLRERVDPEEDDLAEYEHDTGVGEWTSVRDSAVQPDHERYDYADSTPVDLFDIELVLEREPEDAGDPGVSRGDGGERGELPEGDVEFVDGAEANETVTADENQQRWDTASAR